MGQNPNESQDWMPRLKVDFSAESSRKDEIKAELMQRLWTQNRAELRPKEKDMQKNAGRKSLRRTGVVALVACLTLGAVSLTAYAVAKHFKLGPYAQYITIDATDMERMEEVNKQPLPEELAAQAAAADGTKPKTWGDLQDGSYEWDGNKIEIKSEEITVAKADEPQTMAEAKAELDTYSTRFDSAKDVKDLLAFDLRAFDYIPEGYKLEGYRLFDGDEVQGKFEKGKSKYLSMHYFKDNDPADYIYVQVRLMDEETGFESGATENARTAVINGHDAFIDGGHVDILIGDVMYMIGGVEEGEAIKMAESLGK